MTTAEVLSITIVVVEVVVDDGVVVKVVVVFVGFRFLDCFFDNDDDDEVTPFSLGRLVAAAVGLRFVFEVAIRRFFTLTYWASFLMLM